jgi:hypothetical protein
MSALAHFADSGRTSREIREVPCVDGSELARLLFTFCRLVGAAMCSAYCAAHKAAGHNALRGSGPGQKPAFDNALAHVGCPDRRIGRLCITCCSPSQPSHRARSRRDLFTPQVRRVLCSDHPWPSWPTPFLSIFLASAIAATLVGRRANKAVSQGRCLVPWILA